MRPKKLFVRVLAGAVLLTSAYATETLRAGEETAVEERKEGKVAATFLEGDKRATKMWVKVVEVLAGDRELAGKTIIFYPHT